MEKYNSEGGYPRSNWNFRFKREDDLGIFLLSHINKEDLIIMCQEFERVLMAYGIESDVLCKLLFTA